MGLRLVRHVPGLSVTVGICATTTTGEGGFMTPGSKAATCDGHFSWARDDGGRASPAAGWLFQGQDRDDCSWRYGWRRYRHRRAHDGALHRKVFARRAEGPGSGRARRRRRAPDGATLYCGSQGRHLHRRLFDRSDHRAADFSPQRQIQDQRFHSRRRTREGCQPLRNLARFAHQDIGRCQGARSHACRNGSELANRHASRSRSMRYWVRNSASSRATWARRKRSLRSSAAKQRAAAGGAFRA